MKIKIIILLFGLLVLLMVLYNVNYQYIQQGIILLLVAIACVPAFLLLRFGAVEINGKKNYLRHSTLFLLGFLIVHLQYPIDFVLGNTDLSNWFIWVNRLVVVKSLVLSTIGLVCFTIGYYAYSRNAKTDKPSSELTISTRALDIAALIALVIYFSTVNPLYLAGYYGVVEMGVTATYASLAFNIFLYGSIIQKSRNIIISEFRVESFWQFLKAVGWLPVTMFGIYLLSVIVSGDRGPLITLSLLLLANYFIITKSNLSLRTLLILIVVGATTISLLGLVRSQDKEMSFNQRFSESLKDAKFQNETSFSPQTQELASSIRALHIATDYIPREEGHLNGLFQVRQVLASIPFVNYALVGFFGIGHYRYNSSAHLITWVDQGDFPSSGVGTTCIADFYIDLGVLGVIIGMSLFGYFIRYAEFEMYSPGLNALIIHIFTIAYFCSAFYISRSTVFFELRNIVWIFIVLSLNRLVFQNILKK